MKPALLALLAEQALAAGRPLHEELRAVAAGPATNAADFRVATQAARHAEDGHLEAALRCLAFDPLVATVARVRPQATAEAARRLRLLPSAGGLAAGIPPEMSGVLATAVAGAGSGQLLTRVVEPALARSYCANFGSMPPQPWWYVASASMPLLVVVLLVSCFVASRSSGWLPNILSKWMLPARALVVTGALVARGMPAPAALPPLGAEERTVPAAGLDERALDAAGRALAHRFEQRVARWVRGATAACTVLLLACAGGMLMGVMKWPLWDGWSRP